jgi:dolichol kinase
MDNEFKRQGFHLLQVVLLVVSFFIPRFYFLMLLFAGLIFSIVFIFIPPLPKKLGPIQRILDYMHSLVREHEREARFCYGAVTFALGSLITFWIFGAVIFRIAILVLAVGDSFSSLVGMHYGSHKLFYNKDKSWEGLLAGTVTSFAACLFLVQPHIALIAAVCGMLIESAPIDFDDNLTIPFSVSLIMLLFI